MVFFSASEEVGRDIAIAIQLIVVQWDTLESSLHWHSHNRLQTKLGKCVFPSSSPAEWSFKWSQTSPVLKRNLKNIFVIKHFVLTNFHCFSFSSISMTYHFTLGPSVRAAAAQSLLLCCTNYSAGVPDSSLPAAVSKHGASHCWYGRYQLIFGHLAQLWRIHGKKTTW